MNTIIGTALAAFAPGLLNGRGFGFGGYGAAPVAAAATGMEAVLLASMLNNNNGCHYGPSQLLELNYVSNEKSLRGDFELEKQIGRLAERVTKVETAEPLLFEIAALKAKMADDELKNYVDRKDCRNIKGMVGLVQPTTLPTFIPSDCRCSEVEIAA